MRMKKDLLSFLPIAFLSIIFLLAEGFVFESRIEAEIQTQVSVPTTPPKSLEKEVKVPEIKIETEKEKEIKLEKRINRGLRYFKVPSDRHKELVKCIRLAKISTGFDERLILAIMKTESDFNTSAISPKRYKGLMQTPWASFEYPEVDTLYGVKILEDKLKSTNGNMIKALALYKGGNNSLARKEARVTFELYKKLCKLDENEEENAQN